MGEIFSFFKKRHSPLSNSLKFSFFYGNEGELRLKSHISLRSHKEQVDDVRHMWNEVEIMNNRLSFS